CFDFDLKKMWFWTQNTVCVCGHRIQYVVLDTEYSMWFWTQNLVCGFGHRIQYVVLDTEYSMWFWTQNTVCHSPTVKHIKCTGTTTDKTRHFLILSKHRDFKQV